MSKYVFSVDAFAAMLSEAYRSGVHETGGILVGPKKLRWVVTDVIQSSRFAERSTVNYFQSEKDVEYLNQKLRYYQSIGYEYKGDWHRHPSGLDRLSAGDRNTCREVLMDPSYCVDNHLLMVIITDTKHSDMPLFAYDVSLDERGVVAVEKLDFKVLPKSLIEECIIDCLDETAKIKGGKHEDANSGHGNREVEGHGEKDSLRHKIEGNKRYNIS